MASPFQFRGRKMTSRWPPNNKWKRTFQLGSSRLSQRGVLPSLGDHPQCGPVEGPHRAPYYAVPRCTLARERGPPLLMTNGNIMRGARVRCLLLVRRNLDPYRTIHPRGLPSILPVRGVYAWYIYLHIYCSVPRFLFWTKFRFLRFDDSIKIKIFIQRLH